MVLSGQNPSAQARSSDIRSEADRPSAREACNQLRGVEDRVDALAVDVIGAIAGDGVRYEVLRQGDHAGSRVRWPLLVQVHGHAVHRLEQGRDQEPDRSRAEDVHSTPGPQGLEGRGTGSRGHLPPRSKPRSRAKESY